MQFSGSLSQSTLHLKRSQEFQPIGGVRASPLSRAETTESTAKSSMTAFILINATINNKHKNGIKRDRWLENVHTELHKIGLFNSVLQERRILYYIHTFEAAYFLFMVVDSRETCDNPCDAGHGINR